MQEDLNLYSRVLYCMSYLVPPSHSFAITQSLQSLKHCNHTSTTTRQLIQSHHSYIHTAITSPRPLQSLTYYNHSAVTTTLLLQSYIHLHSHIHYNRTTITNTEPLQSHSNCNDITITTCYSNIYATITEPLQSPAIAITHTLQLHNCHNHDFTAFSLNHLKCVISHKPKAC